MASERAALIIATGRYEDPRFQQLVAPPQDAQALAHVLEDRKIGNFKVRTLLNEPKYIVEEAIESFFADRRLEDLLLLYFSGHGVRDDDGQLYLATPKTRWDRWASTAVPATFIDRSMRNSGSRRQVLILDCCYSGLFGRGLLAKGQASVATKETFGGNGRVVLTASDAVEYAFQGKDIEGSSVQSYFTGALVHGLKTGEADRDGDGFISVDELYDFTRDRLMDQMSKQRPRKFAEVEGPILVAKAERRRGRQSRGRDSTAARRRSALPPDMRDVNVDRFANILGNLPSDVRNAIVSRSANIRLHAVMQLARYVTAPDRDENIARAAEEALVLLMEDDSRRVSKAAEASVTEYRRPHTTTEKARLFEERGLIDVQASSSQQAQDKKQTARPDAEGSPRLIEEPSAGHSSDRTGAPGLRTPEPANPAVLSLPSRHWWIPAYAGAPLDEEAAFEWYRKAAHDGLATAQYEVGLMYEMGRGVAKDKVAAKEWYRRAAAQGHEAAKRRLSWWSRVFGV